MGMKKSMDEEKEQLGEPLIEQSTLLNLIFFHPSGCAVECAFFLSEFSSHRRV